MHTEAEIHLEQLAEFDAELSMLDLALRDFEGSKLQSKDLCVCR